MSVQTGLSAVKILSYFLKRMRKILEDIYLKITCIIIQYEDKNSDTTQSTR